MIKLELQGKRLTTEQIKDIVHSKNDRYVRNREYFDGDNPKLFDVWMRRRQAQVSPNNYAPSGYAKLIVNTFTGYTASPGYIEYSSDDEMYNDVIEKINKINKEPTTSNQEVRECGIQGVDYELHFIEKDGEQVVPRFVPIPGNECHPIYDKSIDPKLIAFIRAIKDGEGIYDVYVYYNDTVIRYYLKDEQLSQTAEEPNLYGEIPWNIGRNNIDYNPDFEDVIEYIDIVDALQTNTLNALDKNGRATLLTSLEKDDELAKNLRELNIVFGMEKGDGDDGRDFFEYLKMELNADLREHMLDHFISELHKMAAIFDFSKMELGADPSGTALKYRLYPMELRASEKVAYRLQFLRKRYELVNKVINQFTISGGYRISDASVDNLKIDMKRNIPFDTKTALEENVLMMPYVDKRTLRERIKGLNPDEIEERLAGEREIDPFDDETAV